MRNLVITSIVTSSVLLACGDNPKVVLDQPADAADAGPQSRDRDYNLSSCGQERAAQLAETPYAMLTRWRNATQGDTWSTADPGWHGCVSEGDRHLPPLPDQSGE